MNIVIAGGAGFVGKTLTKFLLKKYQEAEIKIITRTPKPASPRLHYINWEQAEPFVQQADTIINLAGASLNSGRWTKERKNIIKESRISTTEQLVDMIIRSPRKPKVFINASAVGFYGTSLHEDFIELSPSSAVDFLSSTVKAWEKEAILAKSYGVRTVLARFGLILGKNEGALPKMVLPYRLFAGGTIGSGEQWVSWIHVDDVTRILSFIIDHGDLEGVINITAPHPVTMKEFGQTIAKIIRRPHWLPVPNFMLKLILGEMSLLILEGQRVFPKKLGDHRYVFSYNKLKDALHDLL